MSEAMRVERSIQMTLSSPSLSSLFMRSSLHLSALIFLLDHLPRSVPSDAGSCDPSTPCFRSSQSDGDEMFDQRNGSRQCSIRRNKRVMDEMRREPWKENETERE